MHLHAPEARGLGIDSGDRRQCGSRSKTISLFISGNLQVHSGKIHPDGDHHPLPRLKTTAFLRSAVPENAYFMIIPSKAKTNVAEWEFNARRPCNKPGN